MSNETRDGRKPERDIDDILSRATRELQRQCDTSEGARPSATRTRVMMSLRQQERRRTAAIYVLLPAAAVLVASTAWAAANGRLPEVVKTLGTKLGLVEPAPSAPAPATPALTSVRAQGAATAHGDTDRPNDPAPPTEEAPAPPAPPTPEPAPPPPAVAAAPVAPAAPAWTARTSAIAPAPAPAAPRPSAEEPGDKLFEAAHRAHFGARDWPAALAGWDRYLAAAPNGRFVPEARYNRAIALLRLDRRDEAIRELTPSPMANTAPIAKKKPRAH